jgi:hypothetical protein
MTDRKTDKKSVERDREIGKKIAGLLGKQRKRIAGYNVDEPVKSNDVKVNPASEPEPKPQISNEPVVEPQPKEDVVKEESKVDKPKDENSEKKDVTPELLPQKEVKEEIKPEPSENKGEGTALEGEVDKTAEDKENDKAVKEEPKQPNTNQPTASDKEDVKEEPKSSESGEGVPTSDTKSEEVSVNDVGNQTDKA